MLAYLTLALPYSKGLSYHVGWHVNLLQIPLGTPCAFMRETHGSHLRYVLERFHIFVKFFICQKCDESIICIPEIEGCKESCRLLPILGLEHLICLVTASSPVFHRTSTKSNKINSCMIFSFSWIMRILKLSLSFLSSDRRIVSFFKVMVDTDAVMFSFSFTILVFENLGGLVFKLTWASLRASPPARYPTLKKIIRCWKCPARATRSRKLTQNFTKTC